MDIRRLFVGLGFAAAALSPTAHPGPEEHPTVQELEKAASELRGAIRGAERRLNERIVGLEAAAPTLNEQEIATAVQTAVDGAIFELIESSEGLQEWVQAMVVIGGGLIAGLTGLTAFLGLRVRAVRRLVPGSSPAVAGRKPAKAEPTGDAPEDAEESAKGPADDRRIVTHTRKSSNGTVEELQNAEEEWSPRAKDDAIADIVERGVRYVARGPLGNEAEIEVRHRLGKPYLATKSDEHGRNNLGELPDPH